MNSEDVLQKIKGKVEDGEQFYDVVLDWQEYLLSVFKECLDEKEIL